MDLIRPYLTRANQKRENSMKFFDIRSLESTIGGSKKCLFSLSQVGIRLLRVVKLRAFSLAMNFD